MTDFDFGLILAAWLTGLAGGSGHCIGMCGGIVGALGIGQPRGLRGFLHSSCAHLGRITSYCLAGAVVGALGAGIFAGLGGSVGIGVLRVIAAVLIFAIGLQLLLGRALLVGIERAGGRIWRLIAPGMKKLLPPHDAPRAFAAGALWGWLPCGLVYAELAVAAAAGSALAGAAVMVFFGLGTILGLSVLGAVMHASGLGRMPGRASGVLLMLFAIWTALPLVQNTGHVH